MVYKLFLPHTYIKFTLSLMLQVLYGNQHSDSIIFQFLCVSAIELELELELAVDVISIKS